MHVELLTNVLRWPMMLFDTTPLGRVLNRFSKDVDTVDNTLPQVIRSWIMMFFAVNHHIISNACFLIFNYNFIWITQSPLTDYMKCPNVISFAESICQLGLLFIIAKFVRIQFDDRQIIYKINGHMKREILGEINIKHSSILCFVC